MDPDTQRAIGDYDSLLRDEGAVLQELQERLFERMRAARLTFGGRVLCPFLRPSFVSPAAYEQIRSVCRRIFRAVERAEAALQGQLWDRVALTPSERSIAAVHPGYQRSSPNARLDSFLTPSAYQFVELNAESPAGIAYAEVLAEVFLELEVLKRFQERYTLGRFHARERLLTTLLDCYREAGRRKDKPCIAIVDYEEVPTRTEHHLFREFFESRGYPALVADPRHLTYEDGVLRHEGRAIDIVYRRLLVNEFLEKMDVLGALIRAVADHAVVLVNPFRCKAIHKKAIFAVLTDDTLQHLFEPEEREAIAAHVPWTRLVVEGRTLRAGSEIDLPDYIRKHREHLVLKPNDEYGGKGVYIGWEMSESAWEAALATALASPHVVQEGVELRREAFPVLAPDLRFQELVVDVDPFLFQGEVEGLLTRLSTTSLANVSSGGGQVPAFVVQRRDT
jgi:hypothetical protein